MHDTTSGTPGSRTATRDLPHESDDQMQTESASPTDSPFGDTVIDAKNLAFAYGDHVILDNFNLEIKAGEIVALIGPSGCGKSTFLNLIAGIITPTAGGLSVHGAPVQGLSSSVSYMTQQDTLLPWRTALDNAALPLEIKHVPKQARYERARAELERVGVAEAEKRRPHELSGGMRSRLSLARSLLGDADIFLMDEPFAAIDAILRVKLQQLLVDLWTETHKTIVYVTHDLNEAICLGHRVIVMPSGTSGFYEKVIDRPQPRDVGTFRTEREVQDIYAELWGALGQDH
jgi:ABC-type nitrate/sulfonate/bicarbonate transport system ATPase subunit